MHLETNKFATLDDFQEGVILLIDKPHTWTSFDVVNKLRYQIKKHFSIKKIKVGHAGTLDPLATGLLVICAGRMTKRINDFTTEEKTYTGTIKLGETRPSYDMETEVDGTFATEHITPEMIQEVVVAMTGEIDQVPPLFSAKQVDGQRAYRAARKGKDLVLKSQKVTISRFDITSIDMPLVHFDIRCSKGTYIRSIASDFGTNLNSGACLAALRRTYSGGFSIEDALTIEQFESMLHKCEGSSIVD